MNQKPKAMRRIKAIPPITPPTIAPTGVLEPPPPLLSESLAEVVVAAPSFSPVAVDVSTSVFDSVDVMVESPSVLTTVRS